MTLKTETEKRATLSIRGSFSVFGGAIGAGLAVIFAAPLGKRSAVAYFAISLTSFLLGWVLGDGVASASSRLPKIQRAVQKTVNTIIALIGLAFSILAIFDLYTSLIFKHFETLLSASYFGSGAIILFYSLRILSPIQALFGIIFFAPAGLAEAIYRGDMKLFVVYFAWTTLLAIAMFIADRRTRR